MTMGLPQIDLRLTTPADLDFVGAVDPQPIGYALFMGITDIHRSIQLKRFVITVKGKGYGRASLERFKQLVFEQWQAHRFWLDVKDHNQRARYLYRSCGFTEEGILRECLRSGERYETLILMSILEQEYRSSRLSLQ